MDNVSFDEIVSILAKNGRPDLIMEFKEHVKIDEDYKPTLIRKDSLSADEGTATSESDYEVEIDGDGYHSLK